MAGRRPKPTHLKVIQGNPGKRALNPKEPKPAKGRTTKKQPPAHLGQTAKAAWRKVATILDRMGVLTEADEHALERLAECYAEIRECSKLIKQHGRSYETVNNEGSVMHRPRPEVGMLADADRRFRAYLIEFGLTPAARTKIQTSGQKEEDELENYFG